MKKLIILVSAAFLFATPAFASDENVLARIEALEQRVEQLEKLVNPAGAELPMTEDGTSVEPSSISTFTDPSECTQYASGQYKIGLDIPAGEYVLFEDGTGTGSVYETADANGDDIVKVDFVGNSYIIGISDGNYLSLKHAYAIPIEENPAVDTTKSGMFKVGLHIPAGDYLAVEDGTGTASFYVYSDSLSQDISAIDFIHGQHYITVKDGQCLLLRHAYIQW